MGKVLATAIPQYLSARDAVVARGISTLVAVPGQADDGVSAGKVELVVVTYGGCV